MIIHQAFLFFNNWHVNNEMTISLLSMEISVVSLQLYVMLGNYTLSFVNNGFETDNKESAMEAFEVVAGK